MSRVNLFLLSAVFLLVQNPLVYSDEVFEEEYIIEKPLKFNEFLSEYYKSCYYKRGVSKINYASELGYDEIVLYLLFHKKELKNLSIEQRYGFLYLAIDKFKPSIVKLYFKKHFLEKYFDPKSMLSLQMGLLCQVLDRECKEGDELLEMFLEHGVFPGSDCHCTPLLKAARLGRKNAFFKLLEYGAQAVSNGKNMYLTDNLLLEACRGYDSGLNQDRLDIVKYLIEIGGNINYKSNTIKMSPIHLAAQNGLSDIFVYLVGKKARLQDPHLVYKNGVFKQGVFKQILLGSVISGKGKEKERIKIIDFLIKNKTNLNTKTYIKFAKNSEGVCPPIFKALYENKDVVFRHLLASGAGINAYCECEESNQYNGFTPLMLAIEREDITLVETLLDHGANPEYKSNIPDTPFDFALSKGNEQIIAMLIASINQKYD